MDCSPPGSSVHGILQARILEWVTMPFSKVAIPFSRGSSDPGISMNTGTSQVAIGVKNLHANAGDVRNKV